jgi:hypothetical protein
MYISALQSHHSQSAAASNRHSCSRHPVPVVAAFSRDSSSIKRNKARQSAGSKTGELVVLTEPLSLLGEG